MHITLNPQRRDDTLTVLKSGDALTVNGDVFDFAALPDGATLPAEAIASDWFSGPVERIDGVLHLTLTLPHGANPPEHVAYPADLINPPDGPLELPQ
jgi:hypothetical protein